MFVYFVKHEEVNCLCNLLKYFVLFLRIHKVQKGKMGNITLIECENTHKIKKGGGVK